MIFKLSRQRLLFGAMTLIPILIIGYQGCGKGFYSSKGKGIDSISGIESQFTFSDRLDDQEMKLNVSDDMLAGQSYPISLNLLTQRPFEKAPRLTLTSIPENVCNLNLLGEEKDLYF